MHIVGGGALDAPVILHPKITPPQAEEGYFPSGNPKMYHFRRAVEGAGPYTFFFEVTV